MANAQELSRIASQVRRDIVRMVTSAKSGHPGGSLGITDVMTALYFSEMKHDPATWTRSAKGQDAFIISAGHLAPVYYSILSRAGYFPVSELGTLRKFGSRLQGHPSMRMLPGIDMSTGSLGQGISCAVGIAAAAKVKGKSYRTYTLLGDGEIEEGQVWEAAMFASAKKLDNLCAIVDNNNLQIDGTLEEVNSPYPIDKKFEAFGFHVINVADGHDFDQLAAAFAEARTVKGQPTVIICKTTKGKGVSFMENNAGWHGKAPNEEEYKIAMADLERIGESL